MKTKNKKGQTSQTVSWKNDMTCFRCSYCRKKGHFGIFWRPWKTFFLVKKEDMSSKRKTYGKPNINIYLYWLQMFQHNVRGRLPLTIAEETKPLCFDITAFFFSCLKAKKIEIKFCNAAPQTRKKFEEAQGWGRLNYFCEPASAARVLRPPDTPIVYFNVYYVSDVIDAVICVKNS